MANEQATPPAREQVLKDGGEAAPKIRQTLVGGESLGFSEKLMRSRETWTTATLRRAGLLALGCQAMM